MRVIQLVPVLAYGDAIGNEVLSLKKTIKSMGYQTEVYADAIAYEKYKGTEAKYLSQSGSFKPDDVIILHLGTASPMNRMIKDLKCRKIIRYHNITPPAFFRPFNIAYAKINEDALIETAELANSVDCCLADSEFNKSDLIEMGYKCKIDVIPIILKLDDYKKNPAVNILKKYNRDYTNIIFVGRIAPNKKIEDVIKVYALYKKYFNKNSRLFLIGAFSKEDIYYKSLQNYIDELCLSDVIFPGHINFDEILAFYKLADIFLCMSQHEGFCVPLVEAMYFNVPIVAYDKCAVGGTLGGSGILIKEDDPMIFAKAIDYICQRPELKENIINGQSARLQDFIPEIVEKQFENYLNNFIENERIK